MRSLVVVALCGCTQSAAKEEFELEPRLPKPLDVLVVLDDTTAMADHVQHVPSGGGIGIIAATYNGAPDIRIAVTTTTTGTLRKSNAVPDGIIKHAKNFLDGTITTNYSVTLAEAVGSLMNAGTSSTTPNKALEATQLALETPGFVRDSSAVGILLISASDDASSGDAAGYAAAVQGQNSMMLSLVSGDNTPRLGAFAYSFAYRHLTALSAYNMEAVTVFAGLVWPGDNLDYCLPVAAVDVDARAGDQYDCEMVISHDQQVRTLPQCNGDAWIESDPCWQILAEPTCSSGRAIVVGGGFTMYRPRVIGRCTTET